MKMQVNIYIEDNVRGAKLKKAKAMYLLECVVDGKPYTKYKIIEMENCTKNMIDLVALIDALERMQKKAEISIFISNCSVYGTLNNMWHIQWQKNSWINARGNKVKNWEQWQKVTELLENFPYIVTDKDHSYRKWMQSELGGK